MSKRDESTTKRPGKKDPAYGARGPSKTQKRHETDRLGTMRHGLNRSPLDAFSDTDNLHH